MLHILGMGAANPEIVITNKFLEELDTGTTAEWIDEKIGIKERRTTLPLDYIRATRNQNPPAAIGVATHTPTSLGVAASKMALSRAGIGPKDIGMVICNCCTPYQTAPAEAQRIGKELGLGLVKAFDVFTACPAFALHVDFLNNFDESKLPDYILCVSTATLTQHVNYNDRTDGAIWGDGAAAYVISPRHKGKLSVRHASYTTDPSRCDAVVVDTYGYFRQDGRAVRNFSVLQTVKLLRDVESKFEIDWNRDIFIGHQANYTMLQQIINNRDIGDANHWHNVVYVGNQAGAGAPASLSDHWEDVKKGQNIVVAVVGAGLSWGALVLHAE